MTRQERATQIWPILTLCASKRQLLVYEDLSWLISVPLHGLGQLLEPIQSYCIANNLPALTSIVIRSTDGIPGEGFIAAPNVPNAQAEVFSFDWSQQSCPLPDNF
ncbi:MAG: hypothetical protein Q8N83_09990 [Ignavibacteria bacterium]|nr:hypothetical protein [Ignavibacteria bacterium]